MESRFPELNVFHQGLFVQMTINLLRSASSQYSLLSYLSLGSAIASISGVRMLDLHSRRSELGLFMSQGWTRRSLLKHELHLSTLYGIAGAVLAIGLGTLFADTIFNLVTPGLRPLLGLYGGLTFDPVTLAVVLLTAIAVSWFSAFLIYARISKRGPAELIRGV